MADSVNQQADPTQAGGTPSVVPPELRDDPKPQGEGAKQGESSDAGAGTGEPPKWVHQLTETLKTDKNVTRHASMSDLVADYVKFAEKADRLVEMPEDDADEKAVASFYDKFRPASPDGYNLPAQGPDGVTIDEAQQKEFRQMAYDHGMTPKATEALYKMGVDAMASMVKKEKERQSAELSALRSDWGDSYEKNVAETQAAFRAIAEKAGDGELSKRIVETGLAERADVLRLFHGIWQLIKPDSIVDGGPNGKGNLSADDFYDNTNFET